MSKTSRRLTGAPSRLRPANSARNPQPDLSADTRSPEKQKGGRRRKMLLGAAGVAILAAALWFGIPWVQTTLNTVSTDDAYVNSHVTFVAARVRGQVARVLVDDNYRVRKGDLSGRTRQGAVSDRSRDQKGGCRYGDGRPTGREIQSARHRSRGHEPASSARARDGGRRRPGRPAARQGRRCGQDQGRAHPGSA